MLYVPERLKLWLGWITLASAVFTVWPAGPYGLLGWLGAVSPLLRKIVPVLNVRVLAAAVLTTMLTSYVLLDGLSLAEMLLPPVVFILGLLLTPTDDHRTLSRSFSDSSRSESQLEEQFRLALNREVSRCRRHNRPMTLLSVGCDQTDKQLGLLEDAVASVVHIYALIFRLGGRLLVIVPELAAVDRNRLKARIDAAAAERHLHGISWDAASFPDEEMTTAGLTAFAERVKPFESSASPSESARKAASSNGDYGATLESR